MLLAVQRQAAVQTLPAELSPEDLAPAAGTGSALSKFPLALMCRAANCSLLSSTVIRCKIGLNGSADCILSASFNRNIEERPVPRLGVWVGGGADAVHPPPLSPMPVTKGE